MQGAGPTREAGFFNHARISAQRIKSEFAAFDASRFIPKASRPLYPLPSTLSMCECGLILKGLKSPAECRAFGSACTPENPLGPCMVSSEGACAAEYRYAGELSVEGRE